MNHVWCRAMDAHNIIILPADKTLDLPAMTNLRLLALLLTCWYAQVVESCIHDSLDHKVIIGRQKYDNSHPFIVAERRRRLQSGDSSLDSRELKSTPFQPIRMTPYYDNSSLSKLSDTIREEVFAIVGEAIQHITTALQVIPVSGNLFAERFCTSTYSNLKPPVCASISDDELCLEMPIPNDHFAPMRYCEQCTSYGCVNDPCEVSPAGKGIPNTDFLIYVRAESTSGCSSGSTLAYASACQQDQYDRPTFGMVNFCPNKLSTSSSDFERQVSTALHEFSHALGFSSRLFPLMRNEDGTPRTPRNSDGDPPVHTSGICPNGKEIEYYVEPSNSTIQFSTERDHVVAKMITPRVQAYVQQHFNCSTLEGAEMESQDGGCIGSHWEERLFESEYMTAVDSYHNVFSALTLAFFEDSGWYRVNSSTSEVLHFGLNKGCSFVTEKCVDPVTETPIAADHFCTSIDTQGCSVDARSRSTCSLSSKSQHIPAEYQYFLGSPSKGGINTFADFCPINVGYSGGDCSISANLLKLGATSINAYGETYCPACKCTRTSLRSGDSTGWGISPPRQSGCYSMQCINNMETNTNSAIVVVQLSIPRSKTKDITTVNCTKKGVKVSVPGFSGEITCPDPLVVCDYDDPSRLLLEDTIQDSNPSGTESPPAGNSDAPTGSHNGTSTYPASNPQSGSGSSRIPDISTAPSGDSSRSSAPHSSNGSRVGSTHSSSLISSSGSNSARNGADSSASVSRESSRSSSGISSLSNAESSKGSESTSSSSIGDSGGPDVASSNSGIPSNSTDHGYNSSSQDGSLRWKGEVGSSSNSSSDNGATSSTGSHSVAPIANNVDTPRRTPSWILWIFVGISTIGW